MTASFCETRNKYSVMLSGVSSRLFYFSVFTVTSSNSEIKLSLKFGDWDCRQHNHNHLVFSNVTVDFC